MLGKYVTFPELLIWIPFISGLILIFIKGNKNVKWFSVFSTVLTLAVSVISLFYSDVAAHPDYYYYNNVNYYWMPFIGSNFHLGLDKIGMAFTLLTALIFPLALLSNSKKNIENPSGFYALMLLSEAGLMGVFVAYDILLFYFFWELTLLPVYFLCGKWGGQKRVFVSFKFYLYNFAGSLLMFAGILYLYSFTPQLLPESVHSFDMASFYNVKLDASLQHGFFWLFFFAFVIRMSVFPFHGWQPEIIDQAPFPVAVIAGTIMVKMGALGIIRWIFPVFPAAAEKFQMAIIILSLAGMIYAGLVALAQKDLKRFVTWLSISQIGFIVAGIFSINKQGLEGAMLEIFYHGLNILGLWLVAGFAEDRFGIKKISDLRKVAGSSKILMVIFIVILAANIGIPFTGSFGSRGLILNGLMMHGEWLTFLAWAGLLLIAVNAGKIIRWSFFGTIQTDAAPLPKAGRTQVYLLVIIVILILLAGIFSDHVIKSANFPGEIILKGLK